MYEQRGFYKGPAKTKEVVDILCDYTTIARYVRLKIKEGTGNSLNVPELEIYTTWLPFNDIWHLFSAMRNARVQYVEIEPFFDDRNLSTESDLYVM